MNSPSPLISFSSFPTSEWILFNSLIIFHYLQYYHLVFARVHMHVNKPNVATIQCSCTWLLVSYNTQYISYDMIHCDMQTIHGSVSNDTNINWEYISYLVYKLRHLCLYTWRALSFDFHILGFLLLDQNLWCICIENYLYIWYIQIL